MGEGACWAAKLKGFGVWYVDELCMNVNIQGIVAMFWSLAL